MIATTTTSLHQTPSLSVKNQWIVRSLLKKITLDKHSIDYKSRLIDLCYAKMEAPQKNNALKDIFNRVKSCVQRCNPNSLIKLDKVHTGLPHSYWMTIISIDGDITKEEQGSRDLDHSSPATLVCLESLNTLTRVELEKICYQMNGVSNKLLHTLVHNHDQQSSFVFGQGRFTKVRLIKDVASGRHLALRKIKFDVVTMPRTPTIKSISSNTRATSVRYYSVKENKNHLSQRHIIDSSLGAYDELRVHHKSGDRYGITEIAVDNLGAITNDFSELLMADSEMLIPVMKNIYEVMNIGYAASIRDLKREDAKNWRASNLKGCMDEKQNYNPESLTDKILQDLKKSMLPVMKYIINGYLLSLKEMHLTGLAHGDVKPENFLLLTYNSENGNMDFRDFEIKISDLDQSVPLTEPGFFSGTPEYYPDNFEQLRNSHSAADADGYALSRSIQELLELLWTEIEGTNNEKFADIVTDNIISPLMSFQKSIKDTKLLPYSLSDHQTVCQSMELVSLIGLINNIDSISLNEYDCLTLYNKFETLSKRYGIILYIPDCVVA